MFLRSSSWYYSITLPDKNDDEVVLGCKVCYSTIYYQTFWSFFFGPERYFNIRWCDVFIMPTWLNWTTFLRIFSSSMFLGRVDYKEFLWWELEGRRETTDILQYTHMIICWFTSLVWFSNWLYNCSLFPQDLPSVFLKPWPGVYVFSSVMKGPWFCSTPSSPIQRQQERTGFSVHPCQVGWL